MLKWRIHLHASPDKVFETLSTDAGRARFWAESAAERDGYIDFIFPNGLTWHGKILECSRPYRYRVHYFDGSVTTFALQDDGQGGTDLTLTDEGVPAADQCEVNAGWVSVLMALKAAVDFDVDLRNHDSRRTWDQGYADN